MGLILKWILKKRDGRCGLNSCGSRQGLIVGRYERGNEPLHFVQYGHLLIVRGTVSFSNVPHRVSQLETAQLCICFSVV